MPSPLFPDLPESETAPGAEPAGVPRVLRPERRDVKLRPLALDQLLPENHQARVVWAYVESLDLSRLDAQIRAVEGHPGRPMIDRRLLLALWLFATVDGVGSAREVERLCAEHLAYMWLRGDVQVGRATLTEFRVNHEVLLDELLVKSVATLMAEGLVTLERVAQDGLRVRAHAGAGSFRRRDRLEAALEEATRQVSALKEELEKDPGSADRRRAAARLRGAEDRKRRVAEAVAQMPAIERVWERNHRSAKGKRQRAEKRSGTSDDLEEPRESSTGEAVSEPGAEEEPKKDRAPRASTTDPDARVMKMANSGFRPAINCQIAADVDTLVIAGVATTSTGSDHGLHTEMLQRVEETLGVRPKEWLVDGGFPSHTSTDAMPDDCVLIAPVPKSRTPAQDPHQPRPGDSPKVAAWRKRMGTDQAKQTYKRRGATAECVNAHVRNRGLRQMPVGGCRRGRCVLLLHALAHNLLRAAALRRDAAMRGKEAPAT